jgi:hypothetical protein
MDNLDTGRGRPLSSGLSDPMAEQTSPQTTQVLRCIECCRQWQVATERWRVYLTDDDPAEAVAYCPACAAREFG